MPKSPAPSSRARNGSATSSAAVRPMRKNARASPPAIRWSREVAQPVAGVGDPAAHVGAHFGRQRREPEDERYGDHERDHVDRRARCGRSPPRRAGRRGADRARRPPGGCRRTTRSRRRGRRRLRAPATRCGPAVSAIEAAIDFANTSTSSGASAGSHTTITSPTIAWNTSHPSNTERRSKRSANTPVIGANTDGSIVTSRSRPTALPVPRCCWT